MSVKQRLAEAVQALPETLTMEEAVERLYRIYKLKQGLAHPVRKSVRSPPDAGAYDSVFAQKLPLGRAQPLGDEETLALTGDDYVF